MKKFVYFVVIVLCAFVGANLIAGQLKTEVGVFDRRFPVGVTRSPRPYIMFKGLENATILLRERHNQYGYRGPAPAQRKEEGEYRVFVLGGSAVWEGEPPIPALVQEEFIRQGMPQVKVFNYGVTSSVSSMDLARLVFEVADFKPDLIVMYNGANDMTHPLYWDPRPGYPFNFLIIEDNPMLKGAPGKTLMLLACQWGLIRKPYYNDRFLGIDTLRKEAHYGTQEWREKIAGIYVNNMVKAGAIARAFDSRCLVLFQPMVYFKETLSEKEARFVTAEGRNHHQNTRDLIMAKAAAFRDTGALDFVDLSGFYRGTKDTVFTDEVHTIQQAKVLLAKEMYAQIVKRMPTATGAAQ